MTTVLVTGVTGYIGNHVIKYLLTCRKDVKIIASSSSRDKCMSYEWFQEVDFIEYNLSQNPEYLIKEILKPDIVIHLAWGGLPNYKNKYHIEIEFQRQVKLINAFLDSGITDLNISGTCLEYGLQEGKILETNPLIPNNAYAFAKVTLMNWLDLYLKDSSAVKFKWLRLFYSYGTGQNKNSILSQLEKAIMNKDRYFNMSLGQQERDYLTIEEMAKYIVDISLQDTLTGPINICSSNPIAIAKLVQNRLIELNQSIELNLGHYPYNDYEPFSFWGDNSKLMSIYA